MMDRDDKVFMEFINLYKKHPVLWDTNHPDYQNGNVVNEAWRNIERKINIDTTTDVSRRKNKSLMRVYKTLVRNVQDSKAINEYAHNNSSHIVKSKTTSSSKRIGSHTSKELMKRKSLNMPVNNIENRIFDISTSNGCSVINLISDDEDADKSVCEQKETQIEESVEEESSENEQNKIAEQEVRNVQKVKEEVQEQTDEPMNLVCEKRQYEREAIHDKNLKEGDTNVTVCEEIQFKQEVIRDENSNEDTNIIVYKERKFKREVQNDNPKGDTNMRVCEKIQNEREIKQENPKDKNTNSTIYENKQDKQEVIQNQNLKYINTNAILCRKRQYYKPKATQDKNPKDRDRNNRVCENRQDKKEAIKNKNPKEGCENIKRKADFDSPTDTQINKTLKQNTELQTQPLQDEFEMYGQILADKLRRLRRKSQLILQNKIDRLVFEVETQELDAAVNSSNTINLVYPAPVAFPPNNLHYHVIPHNHTTSYVSSPKPHKPSSDFSQGNGDPLFIPNQALPTLSKTNEYGVWNPKNY